MKILVTLDNWGLIGGSERYAGQLVHALADRGHKVHVLCGAKATPAMALPKASQLLIDPAYSDAQASPRELATLVHSARSLDADVVLVLSCFQARSFDALFEIGPLVRFVQDHTLFCPSLNKVLADGSNCHRPLGSICLERYFSAGGCSCFNQANRVKPWIEGVGEFKKKYYEFENAKRTRRTIVASQYMKQELVQAGDSPEHVRVVPYFTRSNTVAIPRAVLGKLTERFLAAKEVPMLLCAARLSMPDKGLDLLLNVLARLQVDFRAVIAGDGPARTWLESKAHADGLSQRVLFAGWQSAGQMETLYQRSSVVIFPSTWKEPFGLVGLEAMAHGRPVVGFDVGGVSEWLRQEHTGYLHARGDVPGMARSIEHLLSEASLAALFGASAREIAQHEFSEALHISRIEAELLAVAKRPQALSEVAS
jgi:glycosyltransferase involved in cell wall biosynthesis